jgi:hypothetical protein
MARKAAKYRVRRPGTALARIQRQFPQVKEVTDATKAVILEVTQADVDGATKNDPKNCAMAKALERTHLADGAIIGIGVSYLIKGTEAVRYTTVPTVAREMVSFDRHKDFAPGKNYRLGPVPPGHRFGERMRVRPSGSSKGSGAHTTVHRTVRVRVVDYV